MTDIGLHNMVQTATNTLGLVGCNLELQCTFTYSGSLKEA